MRLGRLDGFKLERYGLGLRFGLGLRSRDWSKNNDFHIYALKEKYVRVKEPMAYLLHVHLYK